MLWIVFMGGLVIAAWIGLNVAAKSKLAKKLEADTSSMTLEQAEAGYDESCYLVSKQMASPMHSGISERDAAEHLERAVFLEDRINELKGLPHGPKARLQNRPELAGALKAVAQHM